jgi:hypothetical protein
MSFHVPFQFLGRPEGQITVPTQMEPFMYFSSMGIARPTRIEGGIA